MKLRQKRQDFPRYQASLDRWSHAGAMRFRRRTTRGLWNRRPIPRLRIRVAGGYQTFVWSLSCPRRQHIRPVPSNLHRLPNDAMHRWDFGRLRQAMHEDNPLPRETSRPFTARGIRFFFPARAAGDDRAPSHVRGRLASDGDAGRFLRTLRPADPARSLRLNPLHQAGLDRAYRRAIRPPHRQITAALDALIASIPALTMAASMASFDRPVFRGVPVCGKEYRKRAG